MKRETKFHKLLFCFASFFTCEFCVSSLKKTVSTAFLNTCSIPMTPTDAFVYRYV